jgi:hypothetical protein
VDLILVQVLALEQFWWSLCMPSLLHPPVALSASRTCCTKTNCTYKNNRKMKHFQSPFQHGFQLVTWTIPCATF